MDMKSDFPTIIRITEVAQSERDGGIRLDVLTDEGQRYIWLSRKAAGQLMEKLEATLHPADAAEAGDREGEHQPFEFKM